MSVPLGIRVQLRSNAGQRQLLARLSAVLLPIRLAYKRPRAMPSHSASRPVAVIQGGTAGIGLATAKRLIASGHHVLISSRRENNVSTALSFLSSPHATGHVGNAGVAADRLSLARAACALRPDGRVRAVVCNAGVSTAWGRLLDIDESAFEKMLRVNLLGGWGLVKELDRFGAFGQGGEGESRSRVVFNASISAYAPLQNLAAYGVSKTAVVALSRALAEELAYKGVRVNAVAPGIIQTRFSAAIWESPERNSVDDPPDAVLAKRLGSSEDVASVVAFLLSDDARYITGETIVVAGGMRSRL